MLILGKYISGPKYLTLKKGRKDSLFHCLLTDHLSWIYETALFVCENTVIYLQFHMIQP